MARTATASARVARVFLGWDRPALDAITDWLADRIGLTSLIPFEGQTPIVVVPGARAGRMLLARLVREAESRGRALPVPTIITPGTIVDALAGPEPGRVANEIERRLAWVRAMRGVSPDVLAIVVPSPPLDDDLPAWLGVAEFLDRTHVELADEGLSFADVPARASTRAFVEGDRWRALGEIQERLRAELREVGLVELELARALERIPPGREVVLAGVLELGAAARRALGRAHVSALVPAPRSLADAFDDLGCVRPGSAERFPAPAEETIVFADAPLDQAQAALDAIASSGGRADQVVLGVPDPTLAPLLERGARRRGARVRDAGGAPARAQPPLRLLRRIAAHLESPSAETLAPLLTHPAVERWLAKATGTRGLARMLDRHRARHLTVRVDGSTPGLPTALRRALARLDEALTPLARAERAPIVELARRVLDTLAEIYDGVVLDPDRPGDARTLGALEAIRDSATRLAQTPERLAPRCRGAQAASIIARIAGEAFIPDDPEPGAIELVGWLEIALDPAPLAVVVGVNEGVVPRRAAGDPLLQDRLREELGMPAEPARLARDACTLSMLAAPWRRAVLIAGRRTRSGDPIWPSRLLLRGAAPEIARRIRRFQSASTPASPEASARVPRRVVLPYEPVRELAVTSFRTYLQSPYQFYLERVLGLRDDDETARELDPAKFGSLIHNALNAFAQGPGAHDGDPDRVWAALREHVRQCARDELGDSPPPAARVQVELAEERLRPAARWLASRARDGWRLLSRGEWAPAEDEAVHLAHAEGRTALKGRIDRIERHEGSGVVAILDYKTGSGSIDPERSHRRDGRWIDLQLPLYVLLARELVGGARVQLGYVSINGVDMVQERLASWSDAELAEAHELAREVALAIWRGEFDDPGEPSARGVMAMLCAPDGGEGA